VTSNSNIHCQNPRLQGQGTPQLLVISPWNSWPPSLNTFGELFWVNYDRNSAQPTVINVVSVHALHAQFSRVRTSSQALRKSQYWKEYWSDRWLWRFQIWQHNSKQSASTRKLKILTAPLNKRENKTTVQNLKMAWTIVTIKISSENSNALMEWIILHFLETETWAKTNNCWAARMQGSILENPAQIFTLLLVFHLLKQLSGSPSLIISSDLLTLKAERHDWIE